MVIILLYANVKVFVEKNKKQMTNNKQQTTLQTLIDGLIVRKENIIKNADSMPNDMLEGGVMAFESAIDLAQSLLEMEKEQIKKAVNFGDERGNIVSYSTAEQYYNETYSKNHIGDVNKMVGGEL